MLEKMYRPRSARGWSDPNVRMQTLEILADVWGASAEPEAAQRSTVFEEEIRRRIGRQRVPPDVAERFDDLFKTFIYRAGGGEIDKDRRLRITRNVTYLDDVGAKAGYELGDLLARYGQLRAAKDLYRLVGRAHWRGVGRGHARRKAFGVLPSRAEFKHETAKVHRAIARALERTKASSPVEHVWRDPP